MSNIGDLGNNSGHIIVQRPDDTTVVNSFPNSIQGVKEAINHAVSSGTLAGNIAAHGSITISDLTLAVGQSITDIDINGNNQVGANVTVGSTNTTVYAALVAAAINSFTPGVGPNYSAFSIANVVTINAPVSLGSTVNNSAITVSQDGVDIINATLPIDNGSESDSPQSKSFGNQYTLNSTPGSDSDDFAGGEDITRFIVMRGMQSVSDTITTVIAPSQTGITIERTMVSMNILLSAGAPEAIDTISTDDFSIGDQILLSNASGGSAVTFDETGNIVLANSSNFVSGDPELVLVLKLTDVSGTVKWTEVSRAPNIEISVAAMRAVGIAQPASGSDNVAMLAGGQTVSAPTAGSASGYIRVSGSPALTGAFVMDSPIGTPLGRDRFIVDYKATPSNAGGSVTIYGRILSINEFIGGATRIEAWYEANTATWSVTKLQDTDGGGWITVDDIADDAVTTDQILDLSITTPKIALLAITNALLAAGSVTPNKANTAMKRRMVTYPVSWEAAGLGTNITTQMGGKGSVVKMIISVTLLVEATDNGTVTFFNTTGAATIGVVTVPSGTTRGSIVVSTTFTDPTFDDGDVITISTAKVTAGGEATITLIYDGTE